LVHTASQDIGTALSSLRLITSSTAPLAARDWQTFQQIYGTPLLNLYGSTETGWICGNRVHASRMGTVGRPVGSVALDIVRDDGVSCPPGAPGRLIVYSNKLALGYVQGDGALQAIRGKPFVMRDIASMDGDGYLHILGRSDDMINRKGVKVYPAEIENVVLGHPAVQATFAMGIPDPVLGQKIICFVVCSDANQASTKDLLNYCTDHLPASKAPQDVMIIQELPRNQRGKVLRSHLLRLYQARKKLN